MKTLSVTEVAILADIGLCLSMYAFAKVCDEADIEAVFETLPKRLEAQEFKPEDYELLTTWVKQIIWTFKHENEGK